MSKIILSIKKWIITGLESCLIFSMAAMAIIVIYQVISRYLLPSPSKYTEELAMVLMIWVGVFGAALGFEKGLHLGVDILTHLLNRSCQNLMNRISLLLTIIFAILILTYGGSLISQQAFESQNMLKTIPICRGWVYLPIPLSGIIITFFSFCQLYYSFKPSDEEISCEVKNG